jgi:hypothetical protein
MIAGIIDAAADIRLCMRVQEMSQGRSLGQELSD